MKIRSYGTNPAGISVFKINNRNTRAMGERKPPKQCLKGKHQNNVMTTVK